MLTIFESIRKEFSVNDKGESFCSRRAVARMTGKHEKTIRNLLQNISADNLPSELFKPFTGISFDSADLIPDTLASLIVQYYAFKGSKTAQNYLSAFVAIGLRTAIQEATGWNKQKREYGNLLLSAPRVWTKVFGDEFYDELSRLTGLSWDKKTHQKPCVFAQLTYDLVYSHLPKDVYDKIKHTQKEHGGYIHKMHQFLNQDGLDALVYHLEKTLNILSAVSSIESAKQLVTQSVTGVYQPSLFC